MSNHAVDFCGIVQSNVQGILFLQEGDHASASTCFQSALKSIRVALDDESTIRQSRGFNASSHSPSKLQVDEYDQGQHHVRIIYSVEVVRENQRELQEDVFTLFKRALVVSCDTVERMIENSFDLLINLLSGALLYNLGLACHLHGLQSCNTQQLAKAQKFYLLAYQALDGHDLSSKEQAITELGLMAATNNIGYIYACNYNWAEASTFSHELLHQLSAMNGKDNGHGCPSISDDELTVFFLNAYVFQQTRISTAPAA